MIWCAPLLLGAVLVKGPAASPSIDPQAIALLERVQAHLQSIQSLSATELVTIHKFKPKEWSEKKTMRIRLKRPNLARVEIDLALQSAKGKPERTSDWVTYASNGKTVWRVYQTKEFSSWKCGADGGESAIEKNNEPLRGFFAYDGSAIATVESLRKEGLLQTLSVRQGKNPGERIVLIRQQVAGTPLHRTYDFSIEADLLVHRIEARYSDGSDQLVDELTDVTVDQPMTAASFMYKLPRGAHPETPFITTSKPTFASGAPAPDFTVTTAEGRPLRLSDLKGKVVVLDFWATWCGNCTQEMTFTNALAKKYADRNVVVLAVDGSPRTRN
jgi:hypothetical protein